MKRCFINPGHAPAGMPDPGAIGADGLRECDVAHDVGVLVDKYLTAAGVECMKVQDDNLSFICACSNSFVPDVFISIHCNSATSREAHGFEVYSYPYAKRAGKLAQCISKQIGSTFPGLTNRGCKEADFFVLRNTNAPAVLIELAFISNSMEEDFLSRPINQDVYARAIARGVTDYLQSLEE